MYVYIYAYACIWVYLCMCVYFSLSTCVSNDIPKAKNILIFKYHFSLKKNQGSSEIKTGLKTGV